MSPARLTTIRRRLREIATGGLASIAVGAAATNILRIISSMTLTRLLDAHAYGVVGVVTTISYVATMLSDVGIYHFIVRHKRSSEARFLDEVWTLRLIRGTALAGALILVSHPIAALIDKPEIGPVLAVWSLSFVLDGLSSLAFATAVRAQRLWRLSMLELSANVASFVVSIGLALALRSYWALVGGMLAASLLKVILSYLMFPQGRRRFAFSRERAEELWGFSRFIAMSSFLSLLIYQSDKLVLARLMPLAEYGLYAIAATLSIVPGTLAQPYASRVLFAVYAKTVRTDPAQLRHILYARRRKVTLLFMFAVAGMIGAAPLIIELLYDPRYRGVTPFLQLLAISPMLRLTCQSANQALIALGETRSTLTANIFRIAWLAVGGAIALIRHDILLLVGVVGTVEVPGTLCFWWSLHKNGLLNLREEAFGFVAAAFGLALGLLVSNAALTLFGPF